MTTAEANDTSLLLRAGSLAAPMQIVEERTMARLWVKKTLKKVSTLPCGASLLLLHSW